MAKLQPIKLEPGSDLHLTMLGVPMHFNLLVGRDYEEMLAYGRAVWNAALASIAAANADAALAPKGWVWMTHPTRFGGKPIPVRFFTQDGVVCYQPWDEGCMEYSMLDMDDEWQEIVSTPVPQPVASPTSGMNLGQRIAHVGGRTNAQGYTEFGSPMAVAALIQQVLRDIVRPGEHGGFQARYRMPGGKWSSWGAVVCGIKGHQQELRYLPTSEPSISIAESAPADDDALGQTINERDHAERQADKLAQAIGKYVGEDVGEHSSAHCPWTEALDLIEGKQAEKDAVPPTSHTGAGERLIDRGTVVSWAVDRWLEEVKHRPLVNIHRRTLDAAWRQVIRQYGGDPDAIIGPSHDDLLESAALSRKVGEETDRGA